MSARLRAALLCGLAALPLIAPPPAPAQSIPQRIVSLAPSATEVLFEAGAGPRVVGVTSFCVYPRAALPLPKVGGYLTPSLEALVALRPDLIVTVPEHADLEPRLRVLGFQILRLDHANLAGIVRSIELVGERCGTAAAASRAADALRDVLRRVEAGRGATRPRVLICFGRSDDFSNLITAGPGTIYDDLVTRAGGVNVITSRVASYPALSAEGIVRLDPDIIIELAPGATDGPARARQWARLGPIRAVTDGRVHVFTEDFLIVPGPRLVRLTETIARAMRGTAR